jgi:hypothetical protein
MKSKKAARTKKVVLPSESIIIQLGVVVTVVGGFALLVYTMQHFLP